MRRIQLRSRTTLLATALTLAASGAGASVAAANPANGLVGACNMTNVNAEHGMFDVSQFAAKSLQGSTNGWNGGMIRAIQNTNGGIVPCGDPLPLP